MKFIVNKDSLASNAPNIVDLEKNDFRYILGVKEGDHKFLFKFVDQAVETGEAIEVVISDEKQREISHCFRIAYNAPLNKSNPKLKVTFIEY